MGVNLGTVPILHKATAQALSRRVRRRHSAREAAIHYHRHSHPRTGPAAGTELAKTPEFEISQRARKKVEALFAELKNQIGMTTASPAPYEVRPRAVLPRGCGTEYQTAGTLPR